MNFSDFAKVLYPYCNEGKSIPEYVMHLVDQIMGGQPARQRKDGTFQNPMRNIDEDNLRNYFHGKRSISPKDASTIYSSINLEKFEKYIEKRCSDDAQARILDALLEMEEIAQNLMLPQICAQLFETVLHDLTLRDHKAK